MWCWPFLYCRLIDDCLKPLTTPSLYAIGVYATIEEVERLLDRKSLDYMEFYLAMQEVESDLFQAFKAFNANGDSYIVPKELQSVLSRLGLWDGGLVKIWLRSMITTLMAEFKVTMSQIYDLWVRFKWPLTLVIVTYYKFTVADE